MVQALAFAEIFLGLILADAGYKGVSISQVVKGEAGAQVAPNPLTSNASGVTVAPAATTSTPGATEPIPGGGRIAMTPQEAARGAQFGPSVNLPPTETLGQYLGVK